MRYGVDPLEQGPNPLDHPQEEFHECCHRSDAHTDAVASVVGVDRPHRFCCTCPHHTDERPMETDVESLVRARVGTNRLENAGSPIHRLPPTGCDSVVRDTAYVRARCRASHGLPGGRYRHLRSNRGTVSAPRPTHNGDARLAWSLLARRASSSATPVPKECAEVAPDTSRRVFDGIEDASSTENPRAIPLRITLTETVCLT